MELEEEFSLAFKAWKALGNPDWPHYDMGSDLIYLPQLRADGSAIYEFMHEWVHAQLSGGLHGIVIQNLSHLAGHVEIMVFAYLDSILKELNEAGRIELGRDEQEVQFVTPTSMDVILKSWSALLEEDPGLTEMTQIFLEIEYRRSELIRVWKNLHEGVATLTVLSLCLSELDDPEDWLGSAKSLIAEQVGEKIPTGIRNELAEIAEYELGRIRRGVLP